MGVFLKELAWLCISGALLSSIKLCPPLSEKLSSCLQKCSGPVSPILAASKPLLENKTRNFYQKSFILYCNYRN